MDELANDWVSGRNAPFHIGLLAVFEPGPFAEPDGNVDGGRVAHELAHRAAGIAQLRRRVLWTHPGEGRPVWVEDSSDEVVRHVVTSRLPSGATLVTWAANRTLRPLDRNRPLWRAEVVAGLPNGRFAVLLVVHHVLADGLAGVRLLTALLDPDPAGVREPPTSPPAPIPPPSHRELVRDNLRSVHQTLGRRGRRREQPSARMRRAVDQYRQAMSDFAGPLPRSSLPRAVGPTRRMGVATVQLSPLRAAAHAHAATVNDMLLAAVTHGLRDLLAAREECRESTFIRAISPVAMDHSRQVSSMMVVDLPVGEPDPTHRLATIVLRTQARKRRLRAAGGTAPELSTMPVPVARVLVPWARRRGSAKIHLSLTNVPGPPAQLWLAGARLVETIPIAPLVPQVGLAVAALSYDDTLTVAVNADGSFADVDILSDGIATSMDSWASGPGRAHSR